jgi:two-component system chemotaxis sensor kinase CheA
VNRTWTLRYLPFERDGSLEGVLVVIDDITERLAREREDAEQRELMQAFGKLMVDRSGFMAFLREATGMVSEICANATASNRLPQLKRTLHTLKGNAGMMGLSVVAGFCHSLEDELAERGSPSEAAMQDLRNRWTAITDHVDQFLGNSTQSFVEVTDSEYAGLVAHLSSDVRHSDMLQQVLAWRMEPAARALQRLADQARGLARRLGKGDIEVEVRAAGVRLDARVWTPFYADLVHLVRNAVDHGLERVEERKALGKAEPGKLVLSAEPSGAGLVFQISDNGRGIDWPRIAEQAEERGLAHRTRAELTRALYAEGVTTLSEATDISGRGIGMGALKSRVDAFHGEIEVQSAQGAGTTWLIRFPALSPHATETAA